MIEIIFLGTGTSQGVPIIGSNHPVCKSSNPKDKRLRVSIALKWDNFFFVVDCGPDFRQQMLNCNTKKLDGILYTHEHADHTAGLDDIRPFYFKQGKIDLILTRSDLVLNISLSLYGNLPHNNSVLLLFVSFLIFSTIYFTVYDCLPEILYS